MKREKNEVNAELSGQAKHVNPEKERSRTTLHLVESLALVMLCSCKPIIRKQAVIILKEVRNLFGVLNIPKVSADSVSCEYLRQDKNGSKCNVHSCYLKALSSCTVDRANLLPVLIIIIIWFSDTVTASHLINCNANSKVCVFKNKFSN